MSDDDQAKKSHIDGFPTLPSRGGGYSITPDDIHLMEEEDDLQRLVRAYESFEATRCPRPAPDPSGSMASAKNRLRQVRRMLNQRFRHARSVTNTGLN